jgi:NAD(P)H-hydrate epimerase
MTFTLTRAQVRDLDRRAVEEYGIPGIVLMENAGRGCAELLMRLNPTKLPTVILCGPGNNGGDGFVMARHLDNAGWPVRVWAFEPPVGSDRSTVTIGFNFDNLPLDARANLRAIRESRIPFVPFPGSGPMVHHQGIAFWEELRFTGWIADALFGTGLSRPLGTPYSELAAVVNAYDVPVLAIDIPSGLDCDTGEPLGPTIRATHTATFVAPKRGFLDPRSKEWTGEVHVIDIGAPRKLVEEYQ